jgi:uncharacterized membrane protein
MKMLRLAILGIIILTFGMTIALYPHLPDPVVAHWNAAGEADGYMSKFWGLFLVPLIMLGLTGLFIAIPRIDPLRQNYEKFRGYYEGFIIVFLAFMFFIQLQLILWNLGFMISPNATFPVLFGIFFIYLGFLIEHAEQNWFVGIRTPWTLSSKTVWKKTHERGGMLFKIAGLISFAGLLFPAYAIWLILIPVLVVAVYTVVYSYYLYAKERG